MTHKAKSYYIGVDGGGTNTRMLVVDEAGRKIGEGHAGSTNRNDHPRQDVLAHMQRALDSAVKAVPAGSTLAAMALGLGGVCTDDDKADVESIVRSLRGLPKEAKVQVFNDTAIGLTGGLSGRPGLVLIAGTGSACYGINSRGEHFLGGGWGPLVDDVGGGYWLGREAMAAAVRSEDGRLGQRTVLKELVFSALGLKEPRAFLDRVHNQRLERGEIAALAPAVVQAAAQGDDVALGILQRGAVQLAQLVEATARPLFAREPCDLILVGSLALSGAPYQDMIAAEIKKLTPNIALRQPEMTPVEGAAMEALRCGGVTWTAEVLAELGQS